MQTGQYAGTHFHWFNCTDQSNAPSNLCVIDALAAAATAVHRTGCDSVDAAATARVLRLESRASPLPLQQPIDFDAFHSMELTATKGELNALRSSSGSFKTFMEPRENPIRMFSRVPASWARHGEARALATSARAGEYFTFQIGLWASDGDIEDVALEFGAMTAGGAAPTIPPSVRTMQTVLRCCQSSRLHSLCTQFEVSFAVARHSPALTWEG